MMRSSILGASTLLNVLIQHLPLQSLFWSKTWRAFRASDPSRFDPYSTLYSLISDLIFNLMSLELVLTRDFVYSTTAQNCFVSVHDDFFYTSVLT